MLGLRVWGGRGLKPTVRVGARVEGAGAISADRRDFDLAADGDCGP